MRFPLKSTENCGQFEAVGYGQHGELLTVEWERRPSAGDPHVLAMGAHLPDNMYDFQRTVTLLPGETVGYCELRYECQNKMQR